MKRILPWLICLSASLFFFYEFIQGNVFASIADNIMHDFKIQADKMAYLSSIYYLANVIFLFIAGPVLDRYSAKYTIIVAMCMCILSTFILATTHSFSVALVCRFMTGIGSAFCFLGPVRLASRWFLPQQMAMVTGIIVTVAMTGGMVAQFPMAVLVAHIGWRHALLCVGWIGIGMLAIIAIVVSDKNKLEFRINHVKRESELLFTWKNIYLNPNILCAASYTSLMNMAIAVFGAMMGSLYLVQRLGITKEAAAAINSFLFLGTIIGGPVIGWISDKFKQRVLPMKSSALISLVIVLAILYAPVSILSMKALFFLLGFFTAAQIIGYALVAESNHPQITATAISVVSILTQGGYLVYQNLFSWLLVNYGEMQIRDNLPTYSLNAYNHASIILPLGLIAAYIVLLKLKIHPKCCYVTK